jgi:O-methyltransferase involved in polyketide biosynthesis
MADSSHAKISLTARLVAYFKQFSDIPFAREVAVRLGAESAFHGLLVDNDLTGEDFRVYAPIFEARYKSIASRIRQSGFRQVLELASGFSLRGLAMTRDPELLYVESDLPDLTAEKSRLVDDLRRDLDLPTHGNLYLSPANALDLDQLQAAARPFDPKQPLVIVHEGLLQYFSAAERDTLAHNIRALLRAFPTGVWITPDFGLKDDGQNLTEKRRRFRQAVSGATERQMYQASFASREEMDLFFTRCGFAARELRQLDEVPHLGSPAAVGLSAAVLDRLRPALRLWELRPV